ncbi:hypothetical protein ANCCAN_01067 [Ancylostoma caninum]|uniref:Uncharacterized protein n=1 Tax=Ancylostoma caninum TaxID=29170 RepID=A0A368H7W3_ANCCA|nr:hypothetical protein ANCCAN_01067 [Ancylostoma caninum]
MNSALRSQAKHDREMEERKKKEKSEEGGKRTDSREAKTQYPEKSLMEEMNAALASVCCLIYNRRRISRMPPLRYLIRLAGIAGHKLSFTSSFYC